jgi:NADH-quinone oxidoreductase subunit J
MTWMQIIFIISALIVLFSAIQVVITRKVMHAALWLVLALFGVAIIFALLEASFFVVIQVIVYIGAIAILIIFAVMLTSRDIEMNEPVFNRGWWMGIIAGLISFGSLIWIAITWVGFQVQEPIGSVESGNLTDLGMAFVSPQGYLIPFEVASVLLLAALIGAITITTEKKGDNK